ncbi:MAG: hypothetical protein ABI759_00305 [Candidatus Solibacter sp.]
MTDSEKWARWTLGVIALTILAWAAFVAFLGNGPAASSVFALLALAAIPAAKRRAHHRCLDERESEISHKALLAGMRALWGAFIGLVLATGFLKGWDANLTVPVWLLTSAIWWAAMLILAVESIATLLLYRGTHA